MAVYHGVYVLNEDYGLWVLMHLVKDFEVADRLCHEYRCKDRQSATKTFVNGKRVD